MKNILLLSLITCSLSACASIKNTVREFQLKPTIEKTVKIPYDSNGNRVCPVVKMKTLDKRPRFNVKALKRIDPKDQKAIDAFMIKHIHEWENWANKLEQDVKYFQQEQESKCIIFRDQLLKETHPQPK